MCSVSDLPMDQIILTRAAITDFPGARYLHVTMVWTQIKINRAFFVLVFVVDFFGVFFFGSWGGSSIARGGGSRRSASYTLIVQASVIIKSFVVRIVLKTRIGLDACNTDSYNIFPYCAYVYIIYIYLFLDETRKANGKLKSKFNQYFE
jgi:hypothetical protein